MTEQPAGGTRRVAAVALAHWAQRSLRAVGVDDTDARIVADALVQTSLWGIDSHGVARLTHYLARIQAGSIDPRPKLAITATGPCTASMNGGHGLGIVVCRAAMEHAMQLARDSGAGIVGIGESSHCGAIGLYARQAADVGLVGIAFTHADSIVAPFGGTQKFLGTNPIAIAFPQAGGPSVCLDMATSSIPWNRVMNARREHAPLPDGVAIDSAGVPTSDADAAAALLPLGGAYGHKGYALALMIDLLCGPLNAMPFGDAIPAMFGDLTARRHLGSLVIALDPARFAGGPQLAERVRDAMSRLKAQPGDIQYPGEPEVRREAERRAAGIPVEPGMWADMQQWSQRLGVAMPTA